MSRDRDARAAVTRAVIGFLESDYPGTRWVELGEDEDPPADAIAVRVFAARKDADRGAVGSDDDPIESLGVKPALPIDRQARPID